MGIRFSCPNGHKLNVKEHLAGKRGVCPSCGAKFVIPAASEPQPSVGAQAGADTASPSAAEAGRSAAAPSIVIAVADSPPTPAPTAAPDAHPAPVVIPPPLPSQEPAPSLEAVVVKTPFVATHSNHPVSPVTKYTIRRMRGRRLQTTIAIALLVAVVVLGIVLIWVLSHGPETTSRIIHPAISSLVISQGGSSAGPAPLVPQSAVAHA